MLISDVALTILDAEKPILLYPGCGTDIGPLVMVLSFERDATVVYIDYQDDLWHRLRLAIESNITPDISWVDVHPSEFNVKSWDDFWPPEPESRQYGDPEMAFGKRCVLTTERNAKVEFLFLSTEATKTYEILCRNGLASNILVLQDHGFGGNWTRFGLEGMLEQTAKEVGHLPRCIMVADGTNAWHNYSQVSEAFLMEHQQHPIFRRLFQRDNS